MRIVLINMPFSSLRMPSLALTQLASVLRSRFGDSVRVETLYLNLEFARIFGDTDLYDHAVSGMGFMTGVGDWFFRQSAFPDAEDNTQAYLDRFYFEQDEATRSLRRTLVEARAGLDAILDDMIARHALAEADVVGFTALFSQTAAALAMAQRVKRANGDVVTCLGGAACEGIMGQSLIRNAPMLDYVFSGPGLVSFPAFVGHRLAGRHAACETIDGVFSGNNSAAWHEAPPTCFGGRRESGAVAILGKELDINENVILDYGPFLDAFDAVFSDRETRPVLLFETSRGCYWAERMVCSFCGLNGIQRHYRPMTPDNARSQFRALSRWVPRCSSFIAVDTVVPREYVRELFPALELPPGMKLMYEVRADLDEADIGILCKAGVVAMQPGLEALSSHTLKLMRKGSTAFRNLRFLKACSRYPVSLDWNLLIASPGEPEQIYEKYLRDLPHLAHLAPPTGVYPVNIVRNSHYFDHAEQYGLDLHPQDFYALTYPFDETGIRDLANHFVDRAADTEAADRWLAVLNEAVARWRQRWLGQDDRPQARLCLLDDASSPGIYDSRSGEVMEYTISTLARRILEKLARPMRIEQLVSALSDAPAEDVRTVWRELMARALLFEENGRYLSLVAG